MKEDLHQQWKDQGALDGALEFVVSKRPLENKKHCAKLAGVLTALARNAKAASGESYVFCVW